MTFVSGFSVRISSSVANPSVVPSGSRQAEVERDHGGLVQAQHLHGLAPVAGDHDLIILISPFQLALETFVILDDEQCGK